MLPIFVFLLFQGPISIFSQYADIPTTTYATGGMIAGMGADPAGTQVPFGMVRLGPDTVNKFDAVSLFFVLKNPNQYIPEEHAGGFYFNDEYIRILSHIHMVGPGVPDYGNIGVMPYPISTIFPAPDYNLHLQDYNFKSSYNLEVTKPGYFKMNLIDSEVEVELTSSRYVGFHRYTFHNVEKRRPYILFYVSHSISSGGCHASHVTIDPTTQEICGWMENWGSLTSRQNGIRIYFCARTNQKWADWGTWEPNHVHAHNTTLDGKDIGAYITKFENEGSPVEMYVGVSFISMDQARKNLKADISEIEGSTTLNKDEDLFEKAKKACVDEWETALQKIKIYGMEKFTDSQNERLKTFYSAFYRTLTAPTIFSESGGVYLGFDRKVHSLITPKSGRERRYYTDMSIWDTHRTQFPLLALLYPTVMEDIVASLILMFEQGGSLPRWPIAAGYTGCMIGTHAVIVVTEALLKGIPMDTSKAYRALRYASTVEQEYARRDVYDWVHFGFIPSNNNSKSVCLTLAYGYDDGVLSRFAEKIGEHEDAVLFWNRSQAYKKVFSPSTKFFCPKSVDGIFDCPADKTDIIDPRYVEGDAWHYRFFVLHDVKGMIDLYNSPSEFVSALKEFVVKEFEDPYTMVPNKYFWVGNEHNLGSPWLFNFAGREDLTQLLIPRVLNEYFSSEPDGCPGNDDFGTTSAWAVWGFMGFYPIAGSVQYSIGAPQFERYDVKSGEDCTVEVSLDNFDLKKNLYVRNITVDGLVKTDWFFDHNVDLMCEKGKKTKSIRFFMTDTPLPKKK